jgi:hypothetical protein
VQVLHRLLDEVQRACRRVGLEVGPRPVALDGVAERPALPVLRDLPLELDLRPQRRLRQVDLHAVAGRLDVYGTPGPYEDAVQNTPIFEENGPDKFKGIDIMRAVRSFDPCLPCGVHMFLGDGKLLDVRHVPMFGMHQ